MAINNISRHLELPLNKRGDKLCVDVNESSGRITIDLRRWYTNDDDVLCPTSKGVSIPADIIDEVMNAVAQAKRSIKVAGPAPAAKSNGNTPAKSTPRAAGKKVGTRARAVQSK